MFRLYWMLDASLEYLIEIGGKPQTQVSVGLAIIGIGIWIFIQGERACKQALEPPIKQQPE